MDIVYELVIYLPADARRSTLSTPNGFPFFIVMKFDRIDYSRDYQSRYQGEGVVLTYGCSHGRQPGSGIGLSGNLSYPKASSTTHWPTTSASYRCMRGRSEWVVHPEKREESSRSARALLAPHTPHALATASDPVTIGKSLKIKGRGGRF
jgi:hypothetical protein